MQKFPNINVNLDIPCETSINGKCFQTENIDQCIQKCQPPDCYWGMYDSKNHLCHPVRYNTHIRFNPAFIFKPHPTITTFMDTTTFPYPAERKNRIFIGDRVRIQNVETNLILNPAVTIKLPKPYIPPPGGNFLPVKMKTPILFYNRDLDSVLRIEDLNVNWYKAIDFLNDNNEAQFLEPVDPKTYQPIQTKRDLRYSDIFRIRNVFNAKFAFPPMFNGIHPRLNDLIVSLDIIKTPSLFRLVKI